MQPAMIPKPRERAARDQVERLGETAGLVELDVDAVILALERVEVARHVHALVGVDRDAPLDIA